MNRLVLVRPLKTRYEAGQGDVVVGRITEVGRVACIITPSALHGLVCTACIPGIRGSLLDS